MGSYRATVGAKVPAPARTIHFDTLFFSVPLFPTSNASEFHQTLGTEKGVNEYYTNKRNVSPLHFAVELDTSTGTVEVVGL